MCIPFIVARLLLGRHVPAATNTRNNRRIVGGVVFYAVLVVSKESLWVCLCTPERFHGEARVDVSSKTSAVALRVVKGDGMGTQCLGM
jgi:hypothetical protein